MVNIVKIKALGRKVLAVAVVGAVGDWAVYIDAVPGKDHEAEAEKVAYEGDKLPEKLAKAIFPRLAEEYTWRD